MNKIILDRKTYRDKVYACWLGKNIGGTLGAPYECRKYTNNLEYFNPVPKDPAPNDDLDLQLVWLKMLEDRGFPPRISDFAEYWRKYASAYPWNEYGFCMRNLERGLLPPVSGWFENYYVDEMGSPIRSEIWACVAPADPQRAAALAWMDSCMDHAGGEGMWGEMFWAAVESAAFVLDDPRELIRIGLSMIPPSCSIARVIREAVWCADNGKGWGEARERIATTFGHVQPCNAIPNHGFTILGWLYGKDFGDRLCQAVNCGYDTDCTGATLGSVLGIVGGTRCIPKKWSAPVGTAIALHKFTRLPGAPKTIGELTTRTVSLAEKLASSSPRDVAFGTKRARPANLLSLLWRNEEAVAAARQDVRAAHAAAGPAEVVLHYGGEPVLRPGVARKMWISLRMGGTPANGHVMLKVPKGWKMTRIDSPGGGSFTVTAAKFTGTAEIGVDAVINGKKHQVTFAVLAPDAARGYPAGANIEYCPKCQGRKGSCLCV
jgi:ADP-ribosylglycohydrolase